MITVEHLTKYYGTHLAVDDISFEITQGHVYGFLGPNGAGKSTTMNIITGCLSATDGKVLIDGHDIFEEPDAAKRCIGYLPEHPPLYMNESPEDYLRFVGEAKGLRGLELNAQVREVIEKTGIEHVKHRRISQLSKGYKQRVGIAQALLGNPKVIILDEPTVGLDPIQIIEIRELIRSLGETHTKVVVNNLQQDVTIYWVVQADQEDEIIENLLGKYESLSSHIEVVKKNPDVFPTFTEQYTDAEVPNNSIIVESGDRYRYIDYTEIYETEYDYYSYTYVTSGFDGEGAITSAIDYVVTEDLPQLYVLEGHGEGELPTTFAESLEKENVVLNSISLLTVDEIPEEADALMIYAPQSDISEAEATMLKDYAAKGGKLLVIAGPVMDVKFTNLNSLLSDYGVTMNEGIVIEGSRDHYTGYPNMLLPNMASHTITDPLIEDRYYAIVPLSQGMTIGITSSGTVTELMYTSESAFSKVAGFELETYGYEEGDIEGPFTVALAIETNGGGQIVWFSASDFLDDMYNAYSSGANVDLAMNAVSCLLGEREAISIRSKSFNYNYLTISEDTASTLKLLMIGIFPLAYLGIGICVIVSKRRKQNETE